MRRNGRPVELRRAAFDDGSGSGDTRQAGRFPEGAHGLSRKAAIDNLQAMGQSALAAGLTVTAVKADKDLELLIADAEAGHPRTVRLELASRQIVEAVQDLASIRRLKSLLFAAAPALEETITSLVSPAIVLMMEAFLDQSVKVEQSGARLFGGGIRSNGG